MAARAENDNTLSLRKGDWTSREFFVTFENYSKTKHVGVVCSECQVTVDRCHGGWCGESICMCVRVCAGTGAGAGAGVCICACAFAFACACVL